jgi:cytoskeletal protein CcmA (bactofilin family)
MFSKTQDDRGMADAGASAARAGRGGQRSILASDLRIDGIVATEGALEVHGRIDGEVAADSLILGDDGTVTGKVRANTVDLRGTLTGEIASDRLTLRASARFEADATCATLVIEAGATVEGRFSRPAPPPPPPEPPPAATPPASPTAAAPTAAGSAAPVG